MNACKMDLLSKGGHHTDIQNKQTYFLPVHINESCMVYFLFTFLIPICIKLVKNAF